MERKKFDLREWLNDIKQPVYLSDGRQIVITSYDFEDAIQPVHGHLIDSTYTICVDPSTLYFDTPELTEFENELKNKLWYSHIHHRNREIIDIPFVRQHAAELLNVARRVIAEENKAQVKTIVERGK